MASVLDGENKTWKQLQNKHVLKGKHMESNIYFSNLSSLLWMPRHNDSQNIRLQLHKDGVDS